MLIIPIEGTNDVKVCVGCNVCGNHVELVINKRKVSLLDRGIRRASNVLIQDAFSELTPGERDILVHGMYEKCFDSMCAEAEDDSLSEV